MWFCLTEERERVNSNEKRNSLKLLCTDKKYYIVYGEQLFCGMNPMNNIMVIQTTSKNLNSPWQIQKKIQYLDS